MERKLTWIYLQWSKTVVVFNEIISPKTWLFSLKQLALNQTLNTHMTQKLLTFDVV